MEKLRGTLVVEEITGRRGPFCVGMLHTSIGEFKVTDKELDQFVPGRYQGEFLIEELRTKTVPWRKGTFTYIQAQIAEGGFLIDAEEQGDAQGGVPQAEPDPLDADDPTGSPVEATGTQEQPQDTADASAETRTRPRTIERAVDTPNDEAIFGIELYPLFAKQTSPIALDATVDRVLFRQQRERLKAVGYRFVSTHQHWVLQDS